ncbi:histidine--tRNA ligase [Parvularcula sp. ZS-1/3]|uniref:Histidine--tRNA ligase n=1 Tax=Parvularcula mediterranea TaxID=2732508 RepID=A0A7Y3RKJ2_9PROT|nr:histidine--tRNA ligase [Parvularcula mediterranea]NNU15360.1 histidine--tRNA ligase [Parvularcula mediterranea]
MAKNKVKRPKARKARGFPDRSGAELIAERLMLERIGKVYESYGFAQLATPAFEYTDALGKFLPDVDRPNAGVFSLQDDDDQWLSLRYDLTAPLARYVAENMDALPRPYRRYAVGTVWRNEKPGPGRFREFTQIDADACFAPAPHADAEIIMMFVDALSAAGVDDKDVEIRLSSRKVMTGLLEIIGLDPQDQGQAGTVLRAMDKYDRLGADGVALLLGEGRKDESGDYTEGAKLETAQIDTVLRFMEGGDMAEALSANAVGAEGTEELTQIISTLTELGYSDRVKLDPSVIRGLDYYTGPVFEAELTFDVENEKGQTVQFGSVGSGGRYDGLIARFKGQEVPSVGCSVGVSRLLTALKSKAALDEALGPVVVLALDTSEMPRYHRMAQALRKEGIAAEVYLGGAGMKAQMRYADKRGAPITVICGEDEIAKNEVTLKDLRAGKKASEAIESRDQWTEERPGQETVAEGRMIDWIKERLQ